MKSRLFILITLFIAINCKQKSNEVVLPLSDVSNSEIFTLSDSLDDINCSIQSKNFVASVIFLFDGGCSVCINKFFEWVRFLNNNEINKNIRILNISTKGNSSVISYYADEFNIDLENICLKYCKYECPESYSKEPVITYLIDNNNNIVLKGNPMMSNDILDLYNKYNIIQ